MDADEVILSSSYNKLIKKKVLFCGDLSANPAEGSRCEIEISDVSFKDGSGEISIDKSSYYFSDRFDGSCTIGNATHYIDIDFERCLTHMFFEEISLLHIIYMNKDGEKALDVSCVVKLVKIDEVDFVCDWNWSKKMAFATNYKDEGVKLIKSNRTVDAFRQFSKAIRLLLTFGTEDFESMSDSKKEELSDLKLKLYNNMGHCQLQFEEYPAVIVLCSRVLEVDSDNVKALYRRGSAYMGLQDWEAAYQDIGRVLTLDNTISEAKAKMVVLKEKVNICNEKYKKAIKNMFT